MVLGVDLRASSHMLDKCPAPALYPDPKETFIHFDFMCELGRACLYHHVEVRGQPVGVRSSLLSSGMWGHSSGHQVCLSVVYLLSSPTSPRSALNVQIEGLERWLNS